MARLDPPRLRTPRLELIAADAALARADADRDRLRLASLLDALVPAAWPPPLTEDVLEFFATTLHAHPDQTGWWPWYFVAQSAELVVRTPDAGRRSADGQSACAAIDAQSSGGPADMPRASDPPAARRATADAPAIPPTRTLIGGGGFKGPPDAAGMVEIGYSVLDAYQCRGYATEAMSALVAWAFQHPAVRTVAAETFPNLPASLRVIEKLGLHYLGDGQDPGAIRFHRPR